MQNLTLLVPIQAANGKPYGYIQTLGPHHLMSRIFHIARQILEKTPLFFFEK